MLRYLSIQSIVLITQQVIEFSPGLCVLTGETGAGKSIILDALGLCLGDRASSKLLRHGVNSGSVVAEFFVEDRQEIQSFLKEHAIEIEPVVRLRRVLSADGKTRAFINDVPVGATILAALGEKLIEIVGQHDQRGLFEAVNHRAFLDDFIGDEAARKSLADSYIAYASARAHFNQIQEEQQNLVKEEDYLSFVQKELEALEPKAEEEAQLIEKRSFLMQSEKMRSAIDGALEEISDAQLGARVARLSKLFSVGDLSARFSAALESAERAFIEWQEAESHITSIAQSIGRAEDNLETVDDRLHLLRGAARKYRVNVEELENFYLQVREKLTRISYADKALSDAENALHRARDLFMERASAWRTKRASAAKRLEKMIRAELAPLKMEHTELQILCAELVEEGWSEAGMDSVQFLVRTNPGQPFAPLNKIASGGELSRFMLALKVCLHQHFSVSTLIFDEVDTGIGGAVADAVGKRLAQLSKHAQVIVITHQPQVAARGDVHLKVVKSVHKNEVATEVLTLSASEREEEIARMLSGENITKEARAAAGKLLVG